VIEKLGLAGLVEYQEGSVVSRTVLKKETGTVTAFAFDAGQGLSEHTAPFDALVQVIDGEAEIRVSDEVFHLASGEAAILPANVPHALTAVQSFKMLLTMIRDPKTADPD
jgi:quercetin dioxygenase-like cupin family protein